MSEREILQRLIERHREANRTMRKANKAVKIQDVETLRELGLNANHIAQLKQKGGFPERRFRKNYRWISYFKKRLDIENKKSLETI